MPKRLGDGPEGEIQLRKLFLVHFKSFGIPKHRLGVQKFRSLKESSLCSKLLFDNTFSIESFKCSGMDIFGEFSLKIERANNVHLWPNFV